MWDKHGSLDVCVVTKTGRLPIGLERIPVRRVIVETSKPLGVARQRAIQKVETLWFAFVDDDVHITPNWFPTVSKFMSEDVGAVEGVLLSKGLGQRWDATVNRVEKKTPVQDVTLGGDGLTHNTLVRTDLAKTWQPSRPDLQAYEDYELTQHILKQGYRWLRVPTDAEHEWSWLKIARNALWGMHWWKKCSRRPTARRQVGLFNEFFHACIYHLKDHGIMFGIYYAYFRGFCLLGLILA